MWKNGEYKSGPIRITVTNKHIYNPGNWVMSCYQCQMDTVQMAIKPDSTQEKAQQHAIKMVKERLKVYLSHLDTV
jgi:hypothetical protein